MLHLPHLETDITVACQLSCVACNHMVTLYRATNSIWRSDPSQIEHDLNILSRLIHVEAWGALGGEPTLHPQLPEILRVVRLSGIADRIEVWTNGILLSSPLHPLAIKFWDTSRLGVYPLFDDLILSRYEGKLTDQNVCYIEGMCERLGIKLIIKDERSWHNFRNNLEPIPTGDGTPATKLKYDRCFFRQFSRVANLGYFYTCCCAPHQPVLLQSRPLGSDGIAIDQILTEESLRAYLERSEPLGCCSICAGRDTAKGIEWGEERDSALWLEKSKGLS